MVRNYCKQKLIPALQMPGGQYRIPLSVEVRWTLDRLKNPHFWKQPVGAAIDNPDKAWLLWSKIARLYGLKRPEAPKWNKFKRWVIDQLRLKRKREIEKVLLTGCILQIERNGGKPTRVRIAKCLGISRDTLNRRYVQTGLLKRLKEAADDIKTMSLKDFFSGEWDNYFPGFSIQKH